MTWLDRNTVTSLEPISPDPCKKKHKSKRKVRCLWSFGSRRRPSNGPSLNRKPSVDVNCTEMMFHRVSNQIWNFVLPESGEHTFHAVALGTSSQRVFLDNVELQSEGKQRTFEGPDGTTLWLKTDGLPISMDKGAHWILLVNGCMVEEATRGNGLRDLRSLHDGEYTISTGFDAGNVVQNACRKFKFLLDGNLHEVIVAHQECLWQVALDGKLVDQECHALKENSGRAEFKVVAATGEKVPARLEMTWSLIDMRWAYDLQVGGVSVPAYWNKVKGFVAGIAPPTIFSVTAGPGTLPENPPQAIVVESDSNEKQPQRKTEESLPRGVSYDWQTKTYQANIRDSKTKRYTCLGEFPSAELAHKKYLEALNRFDKKPAPALALDIDELR